MSLRRAATEHVFCLSQRCPTCDAVPLSRCQAMRPSRKEHDNGQRFPPDYAGLAVWTSVGRLARRRPYVCHKARCLLKHQRR